MYILEWAAAVCSAIPHLSVQLVQSLDDAIEYNWQWTAAVCTVVPHLSVQFVQSLDDAIEYNWEWATAVCTAALIYLYSLYCLQIISQCPLCCLRGTALTSLKLLYLNNKDHQRMMVDPMLMIVLDLKLFLTAVTPTAVAPTAVIL